MKVRGRAVRKRRQGEKKKKGKKRGLQGHFMRGKPLKATSVVDKAIKKGVYGCGPYVAKRICSRFAVSKRAIFGQRPPAAVAAIERSIKRMAGRGPERKRREREVMQRELTRGTVRGWKIKRGLPVRGQRTATNASTARRLNSKRV